MFDPSEKAKELLADLQAELEEVDRNFRIKVEISFGIPYVAHTKVSLEEEE